VGPGASVPTLAPVIDIVYRCVRLIALLIFSSAADAEPNIAVLSMCQSLFKAYKGHASPCRLRDLRDGFCREFPEIVDQLDKLMIARDSLLLAWQDCPGGLAGAKRERRR